jgi:hypothetical protein
VKTAFITVVGLQDGQYTAGTAHLLRRIRAHGATATVAKTGRVTLTTKTGDRRVYVLKIDPRVRAFTEADYRNADSPLTHALRDLTEGQV